MKTLVLVIVAFVVGTLTPSLGAFQRTPYPQAPPLNKNMPVIPVPNDSIEMSNNSIGGPIILDGFYCHKCEFENPSFTYGGGAFNIEGGRVINKTGKPVSLSLVGAAANTLIFLQTFGYQVVPMQLPQPQIIPDNPNRPIIHNVDLKNLTITAQSPYRSK